MLLGALASLCYLLSQLSYYYNGLDLTTSDLWNLGFGQPNGILLFGNQLPHTTGLNHDVVSCSALYGSVLAANLPQPALLLS